MASTPAGNDTDPSGGGLGGLLDDYPGVDQRSCQLLGPTALVMRSTRVFPISTVLTLCIGCPRSYGNSRDFLVDT